MTLSVREGPSDVSHIGQAQNGDLVQFIRDMMHRRRRLPSQLATDLGVSHPTVFRWLSGEDLPSPSSCLRLAEYTGVPAERVLAMAGHLPAVSQSAPAEWPEFREYAHRKYPEMLDDDLIDVVEELIDRRRHRIQTG